MCIVFLMYIYCCSLALVCKRHQNIIRALLMNYLCLFEREAIEYWLRFSSPEVVFYHAWITTYSRCIMRDRRCENLEYQRREGESVLKKACDTCASTSSSSLSSHRLTVCF